MPNKLCPKCSETCGPRSYECKKCHHKFVEKEKKPVPVKSIKSESSKPLKTCPNPSCRQKCGPRTLKCPKCQTAFVIKSADSSNNTARQYSPLELCAARHRCQHIVYTPGFNVHPKQLKKGESSNRWLTTKPQGDSKDSIIAWLDELAYDGYAHGRYYTLEAFLYFAQSIWNAHNKEDWQRIKAVIKEWDALRMEESQTLPLPKTMSETVNIPAEGEEDEEVDDPLIAEVDSMF